MNEKSDFETILKWAVIVILAIVALKVVASVLGIAFLLGGFLLTRVLPLVLLVWVVYKAVQWLGRPKGAGTSPGAEL